MRVSPHRPGLDQVDRDRLRPGIGERVAHRRPPAAVADLLALLDIGLHLDVERLAGGEAELSEPIGVWPMRFSPTNCGLPRESRW